MATSHQWFTRSVVIATMASLSAIGHGRPVQIARDTPVDDAVAHVQAWIQAHPKDGAGFGALGRIQALAWAYGDKIPLVAVGGPEALPSFSESSTVLVSRAESGEIHWDGKTIHSEDRKERPVTADDAKHLAASIAAYRKAIELDASDALSELGLGWMLAQQGRYARDLPADYWDDLKPTDAEKMSWSKAIAQLANDDPKVRDAASQTLLAAMPRCVLVLRVAKSDDPESQSRIDAVLHGYFELEALNHYRRAFALRAPDDLKGFPTYQADSQISAKAGTQILSVLSAHPEAARKGESASIQEVLDPLAKKMAELMSMPQ